MKKAIVTICIGDQFKKLAELTHPTIKAYADRIGTDFIIIDQKKISNKFLHYEKFQIYDLLGKYHRIIFMDSDLIVRPDCPDLFEIVPEHCLGIFNEGTFVPGIMEVVRDACVKYKISIPKWDGQYYNTGVMVLSRLHRQIFVKPEQEYDYYHSVYHFEQPYLNLKIIADGYKVQDIEYKFNRVSLMDHLTGEHRLSSYIVHYASAADLNIRMNLIEQDLKSWSETAPAYHYPKNIHIRVGGGLGDQIDAEPVIRYIAEKIYPGDNIRVVTDFARVFKHLPVKAMTVNELKMSKDFTVYYEMETLPSPETPLWQFLAQTLCHTTDFVSISTIRRILPDIDKQIQLQVDLQDLTALTDTIGIMNLMKMILVHPGKGWKSKTFPDTYWQEIIDRLAEITTHKVAVIGKYVSDEQGLVDLKCPENVLDLRNLLNLGELMALISQAEVLISNDSAPIHIAGAFDNWIVIGRASCRERV